MTQKDLNRVAMWKAVEKVLTQHQPIWTLNLGFADAVGDLQSFIAAADAIANQQVAGATSGISGDKHSIAEAAIDKTLRMTKLARAYARSTHNLTLYKAVDGDKGGLGHTPYDELAAKLTTMLAAAFAVHSNLTHFGFRPEMEADATAAISAFENAKPDTRVAISGRAAKTASLPNVMRGGKHSLLILDDLIGLFVDDNPEAVGTYKIARSIIDYGTRHENKDTPPDPIA